MILDVLLYYRKLEFSELYCRPGQKPQVSVVSLNMVTSYIFLIAIISAVLCLLNVSHSVPSLREESI